MPWPNEHSFVSVQYVERYCLKTVVVQHSVFLCSWQ